MLRIASFDIGKKNFAYYVEDASIKCLKNEREVYNSLKYKQKKRVDGELSPQIFSILDALFIGSTRVELDVVDIRENKSENVWDIGSRLNLIKFLESKKEMWESCDIFVIEKQFFRTFRFGGKSKGTAANIDAIKICECLVTWLLMNFPKKEIAIFGADLKTYSLGARRGLTKPQRKKWAVEKSAEILTMRGDNHAFDHMSKKQKKDDVCDCIIQCQAFKLKRIIEK